LPKISETVWYVASWQEQWVALLSFSASALKCGVRDGWIGRDLRHRYSRLKLIVNNSRFLILPTGTWPIWAHAYSGCVSSVWCVIGKVCSVTACC
jgi:hypothetical protein